MSRRRLKTDFGPIAIELNDIFFSTEIGNRNSGDVADISRFQNILSRSEQIQDYCEISNGNYTAVVEKCKFDIPDQDKDLSQLLKTLAFLIYENKKSQKYSSSFHLILESECEITGFVITDDQEIKFLVFTKSLALQKILMENGFSLTGGLAEILHKKVTVWIATSEEELDMFLRNGNDFGT